MGVHIDIFLNAWILNSMKKRSKFHSKWIQKNISHSSNVYKNLGDNGHECLQKKMSGYWI